MITWFETIIKKTKKNEKSKKIEKAKAAIKKSAAAIAAAENNESEDDAAEKALAEAEGIVSEIERQFGKQCYKYMHVYYS